jgi:hypothetical protein
VQGTSRHRVEVGCRFIEEAATQTQHAHIETDHLLAGVYSRNPIDEPFLFPRQRSGERSLAKPESSDGEEATARGRISKTLKKFLLAVGIKSPGSGL